MKKINGLSVRILNQIAPVLGHLAFKEQEASQSLESDLEIHDCIEVFYIDDKDLRDESKKTEDIIKPSKKWHLQIFKGVNATYYARIALDKDTNQWYVSSFYASKIAGLINENIEWVNTNVKEYENVTLLVISSCLVLALILEENVFKQVLIVDKPKGIQLEFRKLYSLNEFRQRIIQEKSIEGVTSSIK